MSERVRLAAFVAAACVAATLAIIALSARAEAGGEAPLPPDLVTLALQPDDLLITVEKRKTMLRLSNEVANRGLGPLEVFPSPASLNCDRDGDPENDRNASQRLFSDSNGSGAFEAGADAVGAERLFGCMRYHPAHGHWHVLDFSRYELRSEKTGKLATTTRKVGFCLGDNRRAFTTPASPAVAAYPFGATSSTPCDGSATQGLSVGWADVYLFYVPGQELKINNLPNGRYCLISRVDPENLLVESNEENNVRRTRIDLRPRGLSVRKLDGRCRV